MCGHANFLATHIDLMNFCETDKLQWKFYNSQYALVPVSALKTLAMQLYESYIRHNSDQMFSTMQT